jgi:hypothetical protein
MGNMLFFGNARILLVIKVLLLFLGLTSVSMAADSSVKSAPPADEQKTWMQVEVTVVPLSENTTRNSPILGFARKGQVLSVEKVKENWVKVRANDTLAGWVPATSVSPSGPPVNWSPDLVKGILLICMGLGIGAFLFMAVSLQRTRRAESQERARQAMADAKRRLQNKIQVLFRAEPRIHSRLSMDEVDLLDFLRSIGYVANLEKESDRFLASCKAFKPNLILAESEFRSKVEEAVETDAMLINTPVVYLHCESAPTAPENRVRAYLETNATDKELGDAISLCLRRSPEKIRFSVKPVALKGGIHVGTLMELMHFLSAVKKTGQLLVASGSLKGEVHFLLGNVTRAGMKGLNEAKAVEAVLDLVSGSFEFHERDAVADGNAGINTVKILMDWARTRDESNHHSRT